MKHIRAHYCPESRKENAISKCSLWACTWKAQAAGLWTMHLATTGQRLRSSNSGRSVDVRTPMLARKRLILYYRNANVSGILMIGFSSRLMHLRGKTLLRCTPIAGVLDCMTFLIRRQHRSAMPAVIYELLARIHRKREILVGESLARNFVNTLYLPLKSIRVQTSITPTFYPDGDYFRRENWSEIIERVYLAKRDLSIETRISVAYFAD